MNRLATILLPVGLIASLFACSDDDSNGSPSNGSPSNGSNGDPTATSPNGKPSGALVRVFNAYAPLDAEPGAIDLYPETLVSAGDEPKVTVPYGALSELFDPTVKGDGGDMFLSAYAAGGTGDGLRLVDRTETLKGGEVITYFVATGNAPRESGGRYGSIHAYFHDPLPGGLSVDVPAGKGLLTVDTIGLDQVLADPGSYQLYFSSGSSGSGCTKAIGDTEAVTTGVGPGSAANFALDPGSYTGTVYNDPACASNPVVDDVPFTIEDAGRSVLFVYAPKDKDLRSVVVPLTPKKAAP